MLFVVKMQLDAKYISILRVLECVCAYRFYLARSRPNGLRLDCRCWRLRLLYCSAWNSKRQSCQQSARWCLFIGLVFSPVAKSRASLDRQQQDYRPASDGYLELAEQETCCLGFFWKRVERQSSSRYALIIIICAFTYTSANIVEIASAIARFIFIYMNLMFKIS
jgi:hypothetical protein